MANHLSFEILSALHQKRTSTPEDSSAKRHLATCGRCRSELEWLLRIQGLPAQSWAGRRAAPSAVARADF
ncbi:MAG: hypothetical protein ACR2IK_00605 [Chloroflexota bacterium]